MRWALAETRQSQSNGDLVEGMLVCPACTSALTFSNDEAACSNCASRFYRRDATWDFTVGVRAPEQEDGEGWFREELQEVNRAGNYWLPLFRSVRANRGSRRLRALSIGCGVAAEVDQLIDAGIDCYGVDCGSRALFWSRRTHPESLLRANGMKLPFPDGHFDIVFAGCVFPHIGAVGDTFKVRPDYWDSRLQLARQMARVCHPGGALIVSCPNRLFPLDLFHRRSCGYAPRLHLPTEKFLLSLKDFRKLFVEACGCRNVRALPTANYWSFNQLKKSRKGRVLAALAGLYLRLNSLEFLSALYGSVFAPWLVVMAER